MEQSFDASQCEPLLQELADLSLFEYELRRKTEAKNLGIRVTFLDAAVDARRSHSIGGSDTADTPPLFPSVEPWPHAVDGAALLDALSTLFARYVILPAGGADTLALWTLHSYTFDAGRVSPILCLTSPKKRCGKSTVLALLGAVVHRPLPTANITAAALFRSMEAWHPTLLIDEGDTFVRYSDELRGILNAGHTRETAYVIRTTGENYEPRAFHVWGPKAVALIGKLPSTLEDRSLVLALKRKLRTEHVERLRLGDLATFSDLPRRCLRWAQEHCTALQAQDPALPSGIHDRAADNWRPLVALAAVAGGNWPTRVQHAIYTLEMHGHKEEDDMGVMLLEDIKAIFTKLAQEPMLVAQQMHEKIWSQTLRDKLLDLDLRPWMEYQRGKPITERGIAGLLAPFDIRPRSVRIGPLTNKGYRLTQFADAFARYLPPETVTPSQSSNDAALQPSNAVTGAEAISVTASQPSNGAGVLDPASVTPSNGADVTEHDASNHTPVAECDGVTEAL
jgi:putative DNA primase/helicase